MKAHILMFLVWVFLVIYPDVVELGECCWELSSTRETILEHRDDIPVNSLNC
jgi:hypothetical protein